MKLNFKKSDIRQEKGTWKRFTKLILKSHLPIPLIVLYTVLDIFLVNVGISETDYTAQLFAGDTSPELIFKLVAVIVINLVSANLVVLAREVTDARIKRNARLSVWDKLLKIPMSFFQETNPREAITRVVNNVSAVGSAILLVVIPLGTSAYGIVASLLKVFQYDYRLSLVLLAFLPVSVFLTFLTGRLKRTVSQDSTDVSALLTEHISELITNIPLAKAFHREAYEEKRADSEFDELYRISVKSGWIDNVSELAFSFVDLLQNVVVILIGYLLINDGDITKRGWISFFLFSGVVMNHMENLKIYWHNSKNIQGVIARASEIMDYADEGGGTETAPLSGDITVSGVKFSYDAEKPVLTDVSCTFPEHTVTALLGKSGCGKTTLVNLIDRIYTPQSGSIQVGGREITDMDVYAYRKQFAVVPQNVMLFSGSIRENICFAAGREITDGELNAAVTTAGLRTFVDSLPEGLDSPVGEEGERLSGGQKQKIALARMILQDRRYIILDESTASMDSVAVNEIRGILEQFLKDRTVIIIAHSSRLLSLAERVVVLENGVVSAEGALAEVSRQNAFCAAVLKGATDDEA